MGTSAAIYSLGSSGLFASRAFLPAFLLAAGLRFLAPLSYFQGTSFGQIAAGAPAWFTSDAALIVLAILAAAEMWATKDPDVAHSLHQFDEYIKAAIGAGVSYGVISASDASILNAAAGWTAAADLGLAGGTGAVVYTAAKARNATIDTLAEIDDDDSLGARRALAWAEDGWVISGVALLILFPVLCIILAALVMVAWHLIAKKLETMEAGTRRTCECGAKVLPAAISCPRCARTRLKPCTVGVFGQMKLGTVAGPSQPWILRTQRRCAICAERIDADTKTCIHGHPIFRSADQARRYAEFVDQRQWQTYGLCALAGLVPIIGTVAGLVFFRLYLVAPYRRLLSRRRRFAGRLGIRLVLMTLLVLQAIPLVGMLLLPAMAFISHHSYRILFINGHVGAAYVEEDHLPA